MSSLTVAQICELIQKLYQGREILLAGKLAPPGAWIHEYTVTRTYPGNNTHWFRYAKWQSKEPIFETNPKPSNKGNKKFTNHKHIGRVASGSGLGMSVETYESYEAYNNSLTLQAIENTIDNINLALENFSKFSITMHIEDLTASGISTPIYTTSVGEIILNNIISSDDKTDVKTKPVKDAMRRIKDEYLEEEKQYRKRLPRVRKMLKLYKKR
jgi:hypothetical protein